MINHIAFIMDGNGRWAKERNLPRSAGHSRGVKILKKVIDDCFDRGIKTVTLFAFSTENWSRPKTEIEQLFKMLSKYLKDEFPDLIKKGIKLNIMGDISKLPQKLINEVDAAIHNSRNCDKNILNIGLNYGSRQEIITAVNKLIAEGKTEITQEALESALYTAGLPDPDLIVRTSGEKRLSNFMLYQAAYSELYFADCYWPDFNEKELDKALEEYNNRNRRFGGIGNAR